MFDEQTDAFERLICLGKLPNDHKQIKHYDYRTDLKVELKKRDRQSTHLSDVQKPLSVKDLLTKRKPTEWVIEQIGAKGNLVLLAGESGRHKTSLIYF